MRIMGAEEEEDDGNAEKELLGGGVLSAIVDLLPHVQVVERAAIKLERDSSNVVEHDVRSEHVRNVGQRPRRLLRNARDDIVEDFEEGDENDVDGPRACGRRQLR